MSKLKLKVDEKLEILSQIQTNGLRKTILAMSDEFPEIHPATIKVPIGYMKIIMAVKEEGFARGHFTNPPNVVDFFRKAIDDLVNKIIPADPDYG